MSFPSPRAALLALAIGAAAFASAPGPALAQGAGTQVARPTATDGHEAEVKAGRALAETWIKEVDGGQYTKTWDHVGQVFKGSFKKQEWADMLKKGRDQLGPVKERQLGSAEFTDQLAGAPKGEYVVVVYHTTFANQPQSINEIVVATRENKQWKVVGYSMRPREDLKADASKADAAKADAAKDQTGKDGAAPAK